MKRAAANLRRERPRRRPAMEALTARQRVVLAWIADYIRKHGQAPTQEEIGAALKMRQGSVWEYLKALEAGGAIRRPMKGAHRGIELVEEDGDEA